MGKQKFYLVIAVDYEMYRKSWLFKDKFEAEKFMRHFDYTKYDVNELYIEEIELIE